MTPKERRKMYHRIGKDPTVMELRAANKALCRAMINDPNNARLVKANELICSALQRVKLAIKEGEVGDRVVINTQGAEVARLIAAAPDLLAVAQRLVAWGRMETPSTNANLADIIHETNAVIAKVEGGEECGS